MLEGIIRESIGKKAAKALRRDGYLIANIYAKGIDNIYAAFQLNEFMKYVRDKENLTFEIKVGGNTYKVIVEDYQKDPVLNRLIHVDLRVVLDDEISKYFIPVKVIGTPIGLKNKGILVQLKRRLRVQCKGKDIPNKFEVDVTLLDTGDSVLVRDIKIPENVIVLEGDDVAIAGVFSA